MLGRLAMPKKDTECLDGFGEDHQSGSNLPISPASPRSIGSFISVDVGIPPQHHSALYRVSNDGSGESPNYS